MSRFRGWCFTLNNYGPADLVEPTGTTYAILGKEHAETTGTNHLQGYLYFPNPVRMSTVKAMYPRAHIEQARGSPAQNQEYCAKENNFSEFGQLPMSPNAKGQAEKDRWTDIIDLARLGSWEAIKDKYPDVYATRLNTLENLHRKRPRECKTLDGDMLHKWVYGSTGVGKSKACRLEFPGAFIKDPNTPWWDGYDFEDTVIIDDFDKYQKSQGGDMKRWMDRYPFQAQFKGGYTLIRPKRIIVTSQYTPAEIWDDEKTVEAIMRRVTMVDCDELEGIPKEPKERRKTLDWLADHYGAK